MDNTINRRDFIKHTTTATVGLGLGAGALLAACGSGGASDAAQADAAPAAGTDNSAPAAMAKRMLGALEVTELGLGCMNIAWAYGPSTGKDASIALVRKAYEEGIRFFDTAEIYGPFISEQIVGEALEPYRNEVVIASKIGFDIDFETGEQHGLTSRPEHIRLAVEQMLKRLRTDRIDLLYQHRLDPQVPIEET
ncbi:MAG TPA: aldo/keto reductase, partial [Flavobacteriales bacterium]|nr:aldo/keto reductase [Flavobacteriales bacterium]